MKDFVRGVKAILTGKLTLAEYAGLFCGALALACSVATFVCLFGREGSSATIYSLLSIILYRNSSDLLGD